MDSNRFNKQDADIFWSKNAHIKRKRANYKLPRDVLRDPTAEADDQWSVQREKNVREEKTITAVTRLWLTSNPPLSPTWLPFTPLHPFFCLSYF